MEQDPLFTLEWEYKVKKWEWELTDGSGREWEYELHFCSPLMQSSKHTAGQYGLLDITH